MAAAYSALIWAAGCFNLVEKLGGKSVISHSIDPFDDDDMCQEVLLLVDEPTQDWIKGDPLTFTSAKQRLLLVDKPGISSLPGAVQQAQGDVVLLHEASRPNFRELAQAVLKQAGEGVGCAPYLSLEMLGTPVQVSEDSQGTQPAADNFLGPVEQVSVQAVESTLELPRMALLQTPQVFPRVQLLDALKADSQPGVRRFGECAALFMVHGGQLVAVHGLAGNINLVDDESRRLLLKLMGGPARKPKDRYGGLGW